MLRRLERQGRQHDGRPPGAGPTSSSTPGAPCTSSARPSIRGSIDRSPSVEQSPSISASRRPAPCCSIARRPSRSASSTSGISSARRTAISRTGSRWPATPSWSCRRRSSLHRSRPRGTLALLLSDPEPLALHPEELRVADDSLHSSRRCSSMNRCRWSLLLLKGHRLDLSQGRRRPDRDAAGAAPRSGARAHGFARRADRDLLISGR